MQKICQVYQLKTDKLINWQTNKLKVVFFGTPEFGAIVLEKLVAIGYWLVAVITAPDKPVGRKQILTPSPAKISALKYNIPVLQPEILANYKLQITNYKPDLIVVAAYGKIIPKEILDVPKYGCLNVHPSLLPKYRGPSPIQVAILNGDKKTGVTIILMDEKMDHGPILVQQEWKIQSTKSKIQNKSQIQNSKITYPEFNRKLAEMGAKLLIETIPKWIAGKIKPRLQDETKATYTKILRKEDGKIDWTKPAEYIERQIRALNPWPSTYTLLKIQMSKSKFQIKSKIPRRSPAYDGTLRGRQNSKVLKIYEAEVLPCKINKQPGEVFLTEDKKMAVQTGQDCLIIEKLQLEGGKMLDAKDFLNGHPEIIGTILE